jgi:hypothetical protein
MAAKPPEFASDFTEGTVSSQLVYEGGLLKVRRDEVRLPDGHPAWREYVVHPGAVMMLAFVDPGTIRSIATSSSFPRASSSRARTRSPPRSASSSRNAGSRPASGGRSRRSIRPSAIPPR